MDINTFKGAVVTSMGRGGLILQKNSPEILLTLGIFGVLYATYMASKATYLKADEILEEAEDQLKKIQKVKENTELDKYSDEDFKKDIGIVYVKTGVSFIKLYGPSIAVMFGSIGCILSARHIMHSRNLAIMSAYNLIQGSYAAYRQRVVEDHGLETDRKYRLGLREEIVTDSETDPETGKKSKKKSTVLKFDPNWVSDYARFFDESSAEWKKTPQHNMFFLKTQQNHLNDKFKIRGHMFLNEVYDALDIPRTEAGTMVGWLYDPKDEGLGDNYIDFGLYDSNNTSSRDYVNGYARGILLDFNVDGLIYNKI